MELLPFLPSCTLHFARTVSEPRPVSYASRMPFLPMMMPPVGKSGPGRTFIKSSVDTSGSSSMRQVASIVSPRLCGGMFVAMPTAMPFEPLTRRFGKRAGSTVGSSKLSS